MAGAYLPPSSSTSSTSSAHSAVPFTAFVYFPSIFLTNLITSALRRHFSTVEIISSLPSPAPHPLLQFADYDLLDHSLTLDHVLKSHVLSSSYIIRKSLIRKHYLASAVQQYLAKHAESLLKTAVPKTWAVEIRFVDEMEEMWGDELWDLGRDVDEQADCGEEETGKGTRRWYILKPGMADKGQGIRMFSTKEELEEIFEEFEEDSEDEDAEDAEDQPPSDVDAENEESTRISTQQMRHFVIQEYVPHPLLLDPLPPSTHPFTPHKFHLRAYCISHRSSPLTLFLHPRILCLFAADPFTPPTSPMTQEKLMAHLTNTCLQREETKADYVLELDELVGREWSAAGKQEVIEQDDVKEIRKGVGEVLAETWRAAVGAGMVHFQPLPNAFELFGCDLLVSCPPSSADAIPGTSKFQLHLLEINACPDVEQTGTRLNGVIEDLVEGIVQEVIVPWAGALTPPDRSQGTSHGEAQGEKVSGLLKILELGVRGA